MQGLYHEILVNNWGQHQIETGTIADRYLWLNHCFHVIQTYF